MVPRYEQRQSPPGFLLLSMRSVDPWPQTFLVNQFYIAQYHIQCLSGPQQQWFPTHANLCENKVNFTQKTLGLRIKWKKPQERILKKCSLSMFKSWGSVVGKLAARTNSRFSFVEIQSTIMMGEMSTMQYVQYLTLFKVILILTLNNYIITSIERKTDILVILQRLRGLIIYASYYKLSFAWTQKQEETAGLALSNGNKFYLPAPLKLTY